MRLALILILLPLILPVTETNAQLVEKKWQSLGIFPHGVECIYFLDIPGPPRIGFVGDSGSVFRTTDGGQTWTTVLIDNNLLPSDFIFKDPDTGWFANFTDGGAQVYKTVDGGVTWSALNAPTPQATSVFYNRHNGLLLLSSWEGKTQWGMLCASTDEGVNWSVVSTTDFYNGFAFMNGDSGIVTLRNLGAYRTTDGGHTWFQPASLPQETWQANPDTIRRVMWEPSERPPPCMLYHTTDFGENFTTVEAIPKITGTMREGSCGALYMQTTAQADKSVQGILESQDGLTWTSLLDQKGSAGPTNILDTRFYVKGGFVFAGGTMPGDTVSRLWLYVSDSTRYADSAFAVPQISTKNFHMVSTSCLNLDSSLYVIYHNDCIPAILVSASLSPTDRFALLLRDTLPHEASGFYPVTIEHIPDSRVPDTTTLYLHYYASGEDLYDTVLVTAQLIGADIAAPFDIVANGMKNIDVSGGDTVVFSIRLTDSLPASLGLDSLSFATMFDSNILSFARVDVPPPWTLLREVHGDDSELVVLEPPEGTTAFPDTAIARIFYTANVAPNASTSYVISDIHLNEASFDGCAGVASLPLPPTVTVVGCGDTILRNAMAGEPIVQLLGIKYTSGEPVLSIRVNESVSIECGVFNTIGECVWNSSIAAERGTQSLTLPALRSGTYFVSLRSGASELLSTPLVIKR